MREGEEVDCRGMKGTKDTNHHPEERRYATVLQQAWETSSLCSFSSPLPLLLRCCVPNVSNFLIQ